MIREVVLYVESLAGGYFLWLGLFICSRGLPLPVDRESLSGWWRHSTLAAGLSLVFASWYIFGEAVGGITSQQAQYVRAFRLTWWVIPIAAALWLWAVLNLPSGHGARQTATPYRRAAAVLLLFAASLVSFVGVGTEHIFRFAETRPIAGGFDGFYVPPSMPQHILYVVGLLAVLWGATWLLVLYHLRSAPAAGTRRGFWYLALGNAIFATGATVSVVAYIAMPGRLPEQVGNWIATGGLVLLGFGIVNYNALIERRIIRQDFWRSLRGVAIAVTAALLLFNLAFASFVTPLPPLAIPLLIFLITLFATPLRWFRWTIDRWTMPPWQSRFVTRLTQVRQRIMTTPDQRQALALVQDEMVEIAQEAQIGQMRDVVNSEIDTIFRHKSLYKDDVLARSGLLSLPAVQHALVAFGHENRLLPEQLSASEKARVLRVFLETFIEETFCPGPGHPPPRPPSDRWLEYLILRKSYLENKTRHEVISEIERETGIRLAGRGTTGGRTYATHLINARAHLAEALWQVAVAA